MSSIWTEATRPTIGQSTNRDNTRDDHNGAAHNQWSATNNHDLNQVRLFYTNLGVPKYRGDK